MRGSDGQCSPRGSLVQLQVRQESTPAGRNCSTWCLDATSARRSLVRLGDGRQRRVAPMTLCVIVWLCQLRPENLHCLYRAAPTTVSPLSTTIPIDFRWLELVVHCDRHRNRKLGLVLSSLCRRACLLCAHLPCSTALAAPFSWPLRRWLHVRWSCRGEELPLPQSVPRQAPSQVAALIYTLGR